MKTADIKPGTEYVHASYEWAPAERVLVIRTGVARKEGWGYGARTVRNGVEVRFLNRPSSEEVFVVPGREIRKPWAEHAEQEAAIRDAKIEAQRAKDRAALDRIAHVKAMLPALREIFDAPTYPAALPDYFVQRYGSRLDGIRTEVSGEGALTTYRVTEPLSGALVKYLDQGGKLQVEVEDMARLVDLAGGSAIREAVL